MSGSGSGLDCTPELLYSRGFTLYRMRLDDFVEREISGGSNSSYFARWSPDGSTIALDRNGALWTVDENGSAAHEIDSVNGNATILPIWSPDGTRVVYEVTNGTTNELRSTLATGSSPTVLTPGVDAQGPLEWSPDGGHILFESNRTGNYDVFTMTPDGSNQYNVTNQSGDDGKDGAHWSPDSSQIVFTGSSHIWTINADGTGATNETGTAKSAQTPSWSANGSIYYSVITDTDELAQLFVMNGNGTNQHSIEDSTANDYSPILSPDKMKLAWISDRQTANGQTEVWIANPDGSSPSRATNGTASVSQFSWRPCHQP